MNPKIIHQQTVGLALGAGILDFGAGLGFVLAPARMLQLLGMSETFGDLVYLRFVGAFVAAAGFSYLWALGRRRQTGDPALLRATLEITIIFRLAVGTFVTWAILRGWLMPAWAIVAGTDFFLAAAQGWLLRAGALTQEK